MRVARSVAMFCGLRSAFAMRVARRPAARSLSRTAVAAGAGDASGEAGWLLIDGHNLIYRAFYGVPATLTRPSDGAIVNAVLGVSNSMLRIALPYVQRGAKVVFVLDPRERSSWRTELSAEYKATRSKTPDALIAQFGDSIEAAAAFGAQTLVVEGHEADDVIATLATRYEAEGVDVWSNDKDLMQLVRPRIRVLLDKASITTVLDEAAVLAKFGVGPDMLRDYLALVGDSADNVKGVAGIGPKSAVQLLTSFGTIDAILQKTADADNAQASKRSRTAIAKADLAALEISRRLVTLNLDVPIPASPDLASSSTPVDWDRLLAHADRHGFRALRAKIERARKDAGRVAV